MFHISYVEVSHVKKGMIAFMLGILLSGILGFVFLFIQSENDISTQKVYYLQTGVYQTKENATKMQLELSGIGVQGYVYQKEQLYYVICSISIDKDELMTCEEFLKQNNISYVRKDKTIAYKTDDQLIECLLEELAT